jgi:hypothetical protein
VNGSPLRGDTTTASAIEASLSLVRGTRPTTGPDVCARRHVNRILA